MIRRGRTQLAVYQIEKETEVIPLKKLYDLYLVKTADIIYIALNQKVYGIISVQEALNPNHEGEVKINKNFTALKGYNIIRAKEIFQKNSRIHKIPIMDERGELSGDYSCWDDILYIERNLERLMQNRIAKKKLRFNGALYVVEPIKEKRKVYVLFLEYLNNLQIQYVILSKERIWENLQEQAVYIFMDEDEKRGTMCLCGIDPGIYNEYEDGELWYDVFLDAGSIVNITTYKRILRFLEKESCWAAMGVSIPRKKSCRKIDDKATYLLSAMQEKGIKSFGLLYENEKRKSADYWEQFDKKLLWRLKNHPISLITPWSKGGEDKEFYSELYEEEDYKNRIAQEEIFNGVKCFQYKTNIKGKYFNASDGKRVTCFQPEDYVGTIYVMGMCMIVGRHVEDQFTISSYLQKTLLEQGYPYRVENCGVITRRDAAIDSWIERINKFQVNDIIIYQSSVGEVIDLPCISTGTIFEKYNIPTEWVMDNYGHCNHKVNKLIADNLFEMIKQHLSNEVVKFDAHKFVRINIHNIMQEYVQRKYIEQYFSHFNYERYHSIGAIVMNCDPFNKGHRYLIEQAKKQAECLIIFVIEESRSRFNFEERFRMVEDGVRDLDDIIVVPNGEFVFSANNFREYYVRREDDVAVINAEYDINVFADYIANPLHITCRFVGEETKNSVMKIYNDTMRRILPQKGIRYVEIPKMIQDGNIVKSSNVRRCIKREEYEIAFKMIPESTKRCLTEETDWYDRRG